MIALIKPILFKFLGSTAVKQLVVNLLEAYSKTTDNTVDDKLTALVKKNLLPEYMENPRVIPKKATEESFNELHYLVTEDFLRRIKSGEATVQDLKAACDWLKTNDITGVAYEGSPLDKLNKIIPTVDPSLVKRKVYGKNF